MDGVRNIDAQRTLLTLNLRFEDFRGLQYLLCKRYSLECDLLGVDLKAADIHDIAHHQGKFIDTLARCCKKCFTGLRWKLLIEVSQQLDVALNGGQGGTQFVGSGNDELVFQAVQFLLALIGDPQFKHNPCRFQREGETGEEQLDDVKIWPCIRLLLPAWPQNQHPDQSALCAHGC